MVVKPQKIDGIAIQKMDVEDVEPIRRMLMQLWIDTYINEEHGITEEWIRERWTKRLKPSVIAERKRKLLEDQKSYSKGSFVAKNKDGNIIGMIGYFRDDKGKQELGAIYVDKSYQGKGIASMLMDRMFEWANPKEDIQLGVVTYNNRAKSFYKKWGFEENEGSEGLFDDKIPQIKMTRKGDSR